MQKTQFKRHTDLLLNEKQKKHYSFVEQQTASLFIVYPTESWLPLSRRKMYNMKWEIWKQIVYIDIGYCDVKHNT